MLKTILLKSESYITLETIIVVETELTSPIDIMKAYLDRDSEYTRDWDDDRYFDQLDWCWKYYEVDDLEIIKL